MAKIPKGLVPKSLPSASPGDVMDIAQMALIGAFVDAASSPYLGGGTIKSTVMKMGAGYVASKYVGGTVGRLVGGGLIFAAILDGLDTLGLRSMASGFGSKLGGMGPALEEDNW